MNELINPGKFQPAVRKVRYERELARMMGEVQQ